MSCLSLKAEPQQRFRSGSKSTARNWVSSHYSTVYKRLKDNENRYVYIAFIC